MILMRDFLALHIISQKIGKIWNFSLLQADFSDQTICLTFKKLSPLIGSIKLVRILLKKIKAQRYNPHRHHFIYLKNSLKDFSEILRKCKKLPGLCTKFCEESYFLIMNFTKSPFFWQWISWRVRFFDNEFCEESVSLIMNFVQSSFLW